ncbi:hypothetical protein [Frigoriflavimonas asaccharolytica]|uniref:Uncharacterized protein n=1 Tax=Frigoriflavimonas asaccharolytica TaxID=2735899 RepID=A0A8J8G6S4_9FLAO|nr:hypothetical protein [Frigoriflavimonas asaccharolytica]NRS92289.1 hypothetical protein [Frigoriflavimonas asaccharolytica]
MIKQFLITDAKSTKVVQSLKGIEIFNYDFCVDWAIELLVNNIVTENIQIVAGFHKPVNSLEINPYVTEILKEFNLREFYGDEAVQNNAYSEVEKILNDEGVLITNLNHLCKICIDNDYDDNLYPFYLLKFSWEDLIDLGTSYHNYNVTFENFNKVCIYEAKKWMLNFDRKYEE